MIQKQKNQKLLVRTFLKVVEFQMSVKFNTNTKNSE